MYVLFASSEGQVVIVLVFHIYSLCKFKVWLYVIIVIVTSVFTTSNALKKWRSHLMKRWDVNDE